MTRRPLWKPEGGVWHLPGDRGWHPAWYAEARNVFRALPVKQSKKAEPLHARCLAGPSVSPQPFPPRTRCYSTLLARMVPRGTLFLSQRTAKSSERLTADPGSPLPASSPALSSAPPPRHKLSLQLPPAIPPASWRRDLRAALQHFFFTSTRTKGYSPEKNMYTSKQREGESG